MLYSIIQLDWQIILHIKAIKLCIKTYMNDSMGDASEHSHAESEMLIRGLREHPKGIYFLAFKGKNPAGCIICFEVFSTFHAKPVINIHDIIVLPVFRGIGIGRALLSRIIEEAHCRNCSKITLEVREDNLAAQKLYISENFSECSPPMKFWIKNL